jgi:hypothetical protein
MFLFPFRLWLQKKLQIPRSAPFVPQGKRDDSVKTRAKPKTRTRTKNTNKNRRQNQKQKEPARRRRYENRVKKIGAKT